MNKVLLLILDGWGYAQTWGGNAISTANTPYYDYLWKNYPHSLLSASGIDVGLPGHEMGNSEVGHMNIGGSHVIIRGGEAWLLNAIISPYQPLNTPNEYDPKRTRRLLLKKAEIESLVGRTKEKLSLIPLRAYIKNNHVKIELGVGKPRKKHDKREALKKKTIEAEMRRTGSDQ